MNANRFMLGVVAALCLCQSVDAALIKSASGGSLGVKTKVKTGTSGQKQILLGIDPVSVVSFGMQVQFDADKVSFAGIQGVNGYKIDSYTIEYSGYLGFITNIVGHYVSSTYEDNLQTAGSSATGGVTSVQSVAPPQGEVVMFNVNFSDFAPDRSKGFVIGGGDDGFLNGVDDQGVSYALATSQIESVDVQFAAASGGIANPLPPAVFVGALGGLGAVGWARWRRR